MDAKTTLKQQLKQLRDTITGVRSALRQLEREERIGKQEALRTVHRFYNMPPRDAVGIVIDEHGGSIHVEALRQAMLDGGIALERKRAHHNVRIGIERLIISKRLAIDEAGMITKGPDFEKKRAKSPSKK